MLEVLQRRGWVNELSGEDPPEGRFALLYMIFPGVYVCRGSSMRRAVEFVGRGEQRNQNTVVKSLNFKWRFAPEITLANDVFLPFTKE
jgi:hypothetical protein